MDLVNPTGKDLKRFLEEDPGGEVVMLNLLRFVDGARADYEEYVRRFTPFAEQVGAGVLHVGDLGRALVAPEAHAWDVLLLVRYPDRAAFCRMVADPEYQEITHLRSGAVEVAVLQPSAPWPTGA